jgi:uncharacterized membrane protein
MITIENPLLLLIFIPIGILVYLTWKRMSLPYPAFQRSLILICRLLLFMLIILALAGTAWAQAIHRQATIFVGDLSDSTNTQRPFIEQYITDALKHKQPDDQVGIVAVGRNALVEQSVQSQIDFAHFQSAPDTNYTDLAAGLRLAAAILPTNSQRHIVLLTDGNQNLEDALQEAQILQQEGIRLDIVPLPSTSGNEARIDSMNAPTTLRINEHFLLHIKVSSTITQDATIRIYLDNALVTTQPIKITSGEQELSFDLAAPSSGFHTFRAVLEAPLDTIQQNNEASAFVNVQGPPTVLVVEGTGGSGQNIVSALKASGIQVDTADPSGVPTTLDGLARYGSIILADVSAISLGNTRMQALQSFVRDLGHGLVVSGGQNSYSLGSYAGTPLEQTLPVRMDIPQHKDTPSIAVVLIVESLEATLPINISKEAAKGVVNFLSPRDQVAISAGYGKLEIPMQYVTDRTKIDKAIDNLNPGDPESYTPDLVNAEKELLKTNAKIKHIILLGDGDAFDSTYVATATRIAGEQITISTVATNSASPQEFATMQQIASAGKGRYYPANDQSAIPQILLEETQRASRRSVIADTFQPATVGNNPILTGLNGLPHLDGYVATTPKPAGQMVLVSHLDDPVLSVWQYGLGRAAAWTSDASGLWTKEWLSWDQAARWWANVVTWSLPATDDNALHVSGTFVNANGHLSVDLTSGIPAANTQQEVQATILAPDQSQQTVPLQPTAPEHWEGNFVTPQTGTYFIKVLWQAKGNSTTDSSNQLSTETAIVVPYSPEYQTQGTDLRILKQLARAGEGTILSQQDPASAFTQTLKPAWALTPITFWLLILAALLLPIDIAARRLVVLDFITATYSWIRARLKPTSTKQGDGQAQGTGSAQGTTPTVASLNTIRAKREQKDTQLANQSTRRDSASRLSARSSGSSVPSSTNSLDATRRDSALRLSEQPPADISQEIKTTQPAKNRADDKKRKKSATGVQDAGSMASRLVEAKRKREQGK